MECIMFAPRRGAFYKREMVLFWCVCGVLSTFLYFFVKRLSGTHQQHFNFSAQFCLFVFCVCVSFFLLRLIILQFSLFYWLLLVFFNSVVCFYHFLSGDLIALTTQQSARRKQCFKEGVDDNKFCNWLLHFLFLALSLSSSTLS